MLRAALFAGIAGYIDAICFLLLRGPFASGLGGAFAANMTGNLVDVGISAEQGDWVRAGWLGGLLLGFFVGVAAARLVLLVGGTSRLLLAIEAGLIALAATGFLDGAEIPVLAIAMAMQNQAARHAGLDVNVGFVTGDIQQLGHHLVPGSPPIEPKPVGRPRVILTLLAFYAIGAAIGALAKGGGAAVLGFPAAAIAVAGLLPGRWTGLRERH
jgi:uncharacterized membrane protein YoaK (UPF0700 family)